MLKTNFFGNTIPENKKDLSAQTLTVTSKVGFLTMFFLSTFGYPLEIKNKK